MAKSILLAKMKKQQKFYNRVFGIKKGCLLGLSILESVADLSVGHRYQLLQEYWSDLRQVMVQEWMILKGVVAPQVNTP